MNDVPDQAEKMFREGYNCAQSVLAGCSEGQGLSRELAVHLAGGFGGGVGGMGMICGAVSGALMALGLEFHAEGPKDAAGKQRVYALTRELCETFRQRHGSILCRDLIGVDVSTPQGAKQAREMGAFKVCPPLVRSAAEIVEEMRHRPQEG